MDSGKLILMVCVLAFTAGAAVYDWRFKKLPNKLTVPAFLLGVVFHAILGGMQAGVVGAGKHVGYSLAGFAIGFGVLYVLWLVGGGGGGDVKFMGALGAWLGPVLIFFVLVGSVLFVIVGSVTVLAVESTRLGIEGARRRYFRSAASAKRKKGKPAPGASEQATRRRLLPYAVPVALATWTTLGVSHLADLPALARLVGQS